MENIAMATRIRQIPFEEWDKLDELPIMANGYPDPNTTVIFAAENDQGEMVGVWSAVTPIFLEGLWVREDYRNTTVAGRLLFTMTDFLNSIGANKAFTLVQTSDVRALAVKAGFEVIPGDMCMLDLEKTR